MTGFDLLAEGKFFDSLLAPYSAMLGTSGMELFWGIIIISALGLTYMKTRSPVLVGIVVLITGAVTLPYLPPTVNKFMYGLMVFGIATLLYKIYKSR